jgi:hypothetical protein
MKTGQDAHPHPLQKGKEMEGARAMILDIRRAAIN